MENTRRLVIVRHAKAEQFAPSDIERVLSPRGRADAAALGGWLAGQDITPDMSYVSSAARTRETWAAIAEGADWALEPQIDGALYGTDEDGVLELVQTTDDGINTIIVVGHNPTMAMVAQLLDDGDGTATGAVEMGTFPTGTAAVFEVAGSWSEVVAGTARLEQFHVARA